MPKFRVFAVAIASLLAFPAQAVTIDFEDITRSGSYTHYQDSGFSTQGFDFDLSYGFLIDSDFFYAKYYASNNGTDWLMHNDTGDMTISAGGSVFELAALDAGQYWSKTNTSDIRITGLRSDGSTIAREIASKSGFQTVSFSGWSDLIRLTIKGNGYGTFDNFVLNTVSMTAVPIPSPFLMMLSGLGLLGALRFRKSAKRA